MKREAVDTYKKTKKGCAAITACLLAVSMAVNAYAGGSDFIYEGDTLTAYTGVDDIPFVPYGTEGIGKNVFAGSGISGIRLPDTLEFIKDGAFNNCSKLSQIIIPSKVTEIGIGAFSGCTELKAVRLSDKLTKLGSIAFNNCSSLKEIVLPGSLTNIDWGTFKNCKSLRKVTFGEGISFINAEAFSGCAALDAIVIPASLQGINSNPFKYCNPNTITVAASNSVFDSRGNCNAVIETATNILRIGCSRTVIPSSVYELADYAFCGCRDMGDLIIPDNVLKIDSNTFEDCVGLNSVTLGANTLYLGYYAFEGCKDLTEVIISDKVKYISEGAFLNTSLKYAVIPSSVETIGEGAFGASAESLDLEWTYDPDFVIYGEKGSAAEKYAVDNNLIFLDSSERYPGDFTRGDVNGDGKVNTKDVILLKRYVCGWDVDINTAAADVNSDSKVNTKDCVFLARFLTGFDLIINK